MRIITVLPLRQGDENWAIDVCQTDHQENLVAVDLHGTLMLLGDAG